MNIVSLTVAGSRGEDYVISLNPYSGKATCTCPGYRFHKPHDCKHLAFAREALAGSVAGLSLGSPPKKIKLWRHEKTRDV